MKVRSSYITTLLTAGAATLAIAAAPIASADSTSGMACNAAGGGTECQSPGDSEIYDSPPPINFDPYGGYGFAIGGFAGPRFHGGGGMHR